MISSPQLEGYNYTINYDNITHNIGTKPKQDILKKQQLYDDRQYKLYITNIVCIFVMCIILYLFWHFTKNFSKDIIFIGIGIFFFICYMFKHHITLAIIALMLLPSMLIDSVPLGCVKTEMGKIDCI